jgi:hypothetical protein
VYVSVSARPEPDLALGFDVLDGHKVVASYPTLAEAQAHARRKARFCVRYWGAKKEEA